MGSNSLYEYVQILVKLESYSDIPKDLISSLSSYTLSIYRSDQENRYSEPMPWIGIYIVLASLICVLAILADLLNGLRNKKLWFPCRYFTLNAASLSVIAVAMKIPMDLNNSMPGNVDQTTKLGSMAFMCTMMANFLPSLATMNSKELVTNILALGILVTTLVVNVCIQIKTGVVSYSEAEHFNETVSDVKRQSPYIFVYINRNRSIALIYVAIILFLLIIQTCSALTIIRSKQILELKYQAGHKTTSKEQELQEPKRLTVEKLKLLVRNYLIMAGTGNPQFIIACSSTSTATGVICTLSTVIHVILMILTIGSVRDHKSDYKWSMLLILIIQFIGVVLGTIAPLSRCFASLSFKLTKKWIQIHIKVFKVETYWTQKLSDWRHSSLPFSFSRRWKIVIQNIKFLTLSFCIRIQKTVVVACKMIALIPTFIVIFVLYCVRCWKWIKVTFCASSVLVVNSLNHLEDNKDLKKYVLQLHDDMELAERTLYGMTRSVNFVIQNAEKQQPKNLMKLLENSSGFEGVGRYDSHHVPQLTAEEHLDCWSLPLVTLTAIAISLHKVPSNIVYRLLSSVSEGLVYVSHVEETLNATDDSARIQKAARTLWLEVEVNHKWFSNKLRKLAPQVNTAERILEWFRDTAKNMVMEVEGMDVEGSNEHPFFSSICANTMYRITQTILLSYQDNTDEVSEEELFVQLSSIISGILAACLSNLPQVIAIKCHQSAIEKREESIHAAANLLGETMQIINTLQDRELPSLNPDELAYIDKWHAYFKHPSP
ncbi:hypothetical protein CTI12_AA420450 [Artemisia annua]|uniref:Uncharacterized protein n=1 Tax=Artemisia annua TaxID=35608 RepID=A0A2U1M4Q0_ARTAN|nr:hypothetical protein CTI12_AA420450 [Artemisia annua]